MSEPKQDDWLDNLFDLIDRKIPEHHLKAKFIADCKQSVKSKLNEAIENLEIEHIKEIEALAAIANEAVTAARLDEITRYGKKIMDVKTVPSNFEFAWLVEHLGRHMNARINELRQKESK